jgi:hypothetical protein
MNAELIGLDGYGLCNATAQPLECINRNTMLNPYQVDQTIALSGDVGLDVFGFMKTRYPEYEWIIEEPFANSDTVEGWRNYLLLIMEQIDGNRKARANGTIPLDFVGLVAMISTLSSLVRLNEEDLSICPLEQQRYQALRPNDNEADSEFKKRQRKFLDGDSCRFRWFVCKFMAADIEDRELVAQTLYKSVRCGLVHGLNIGPTSGHSSSRARCSVMSKNLSDTGWCEVLLSGRYVVFYFEELFSCVKGLLNRLFVHQSQDLDVCRFLNDAAGEMGRTQFIKVLKGTRNVAR